MEKYLQNSIFKYELILSLGETVQTKVCKPLVHEGADLTKLSGQVQNLRYKPLLQTFGTNLWSKPLVQAFGVNI